MIPSQPVILLTGRPGIGKTTVVREIAARLGARAGGFFTREVRIQGQRTGFEIVTLAGQSGYLATTLPDLTFAEEVPFGKYRVNLEGIDSLAVPALITALRQGQVIVIDEIGPMEMLSARFCQVVLEILDSGAAVVGTIVQRPHPFADRVKAHPRVRIKPVTVANRDRLAGQVYAELSRHLN